MNRQFIPPAAHNPELIADELVVLDDEHAAAAEQLIVDQLAGKTPGQIGKPTGCPPTRISAGGSISETWL